MIIFSGIILGILLLIAITMIVLASVDIRSGFYVKTFSYLPVKERIIALTFDDGPHPDITPLVLSILKKYEIKATFFCLGDNLEKNKDLALRVIKEGHLIGNHAYYHSAFFPYYSSKRMKNEIEVCQYQIDLINPPNTPKIFRPPYGATNHNLKKALENTDFKVIGWSIRALDTIFSNPVIILQRVTSRIRPGSILVFHDSQFYTPEIIERVIIFALKRGYKFVRIDKYL